MHKNATKCNKTQSKWCKNKHGASKIIDTFEMYHPCLDILCFIGGSHPPRTKASLHREDHVPRCLRREIGPQKHVMQYDEEKDKFVQRSMADQQARDARAVEAQKKEVAKAERAKKARFDRIVTMLDLSNGEYREMRKNNLFSMAKTTKDNSFHLKEKELIFKEIYAKVTKD
jgi:hypothetical protein